MPILLNVVVFGVVGVSLRYLALQLGQAWGAGAGIYVIFFCNIIGSFVVGGLFSLKASWPSFPDSIVIGIGVGLLGGLTTFSTYSWDTLRLLMSGQAIKALIYFIVTPLMGLLSCWLGFYLMKLIFPGRG